MKITQRQFLTILIAVITFTLVINLGQVYSFWNIAETILIVSRWATMILLGWYAFRKKSLTTWILISMIVGAEFGHDMPTIAIHLNLFSKIFLNMVKTIIAPLLFATLVVGIAGHSNLRQVGRMGWKSIVYFELVSTVALFIGLLAINISRAGIGVIIPAEISQQNIPVIKAQTFEEVILHIFPENIAKAIYEGQVLQIVVFSIIFGIAVAMLKDQHRNRMVHFAESLSETMFKFTNLVMYLAPVAVFAAIAYSVGHMGLSILGNLIQLLATLYVALIILLLTVFLPVALIMKIPVRSFIKAVSEPATIAFATTSSESALPIAMEAMEKFGVPRKIVAFVMPTGYSFNLDGTTLYLSLATIFVAQVAGIDLTIVRQLLIVFTLMLTSKGVAGVPRASLVILLGTAASFGLPTWPIFIILGIDELMDMARTGVNVVGNCLATAVVARWEGEFDENAAKNFSTKMME
ncbi:MAG TPA: cation:dicarboxylase symporter family transporter [Bacteroidales bacterium]